MTYNIGQLLEYEDVRGQWHFVMVTAINWPMFSFRCLSMNAGGQADHADTTFRRVTAERLVELTTPSVSKPFCSHTPVCADAREHSGKLADGHFEPERTVNDDHQDAEVQRSSETHPCLDCGRPTSYFAQKMHSGYWLCRDGEGCNVPRASEALPSLDPGCDCRERNISCIHWMKAVQAQGTNEAIVWADEASPFTGAQVKALLEENERLRHEHATDLVQIEMLKTLTQRPNEAQVAHQKLEVAHQKLETARRRQALSDAAIHRSLRRISERMGLAKMYDHDPVGFVGVLESEVNNDKERIVGGCKAENEAARSGDSEVIGDKDREEQHDAHVLEDDDVCDGRLGSGSDPPSKTEGEPKQDLVVEAGTGGRFGCCGAEPAYIRGRPVPHSHPQRSNDRQSVWEAAVDRCVTVVQDARETGQTDLRSIIARLRAQRSETAKVEGEKR